MQAHIEYRVPSAFTAVNPLKRSTDLVVRLELLTPSRIPHTPERRDIHVVERLLEACPDTFVGTLVDGNANLKNVELQLVLDWFMPALSRAVGIRARGS